MSPEAVSWNELEPILREDLQGLPLTEMDYGYGGGLHRVARDQVEVARDILNALEARGYYLMRVDATVCTHWAHADTQDLSDAAEQVGLGAVPLLYLGHNLEEQGIHLMKEKT